jgi:hypothetical protein
VLPKNYIICPNTLVLETVTGEKYIVKSDVAEENTVYCVLRRQALCTSDIAVCTVLPRAQTATAATATSKYEFTCTS